MTLTDESEDESKCGSGFLFFVVSFLFEDTRKGRVGLRGLSERRTLKPLRLIQPQRRKLVISVRKLVPSSLQPVQQTGDWTHKGGQNIYSCVLFFFRAGSHEHMFKLGGNQGI